MGDERLMDHQQAWNPANTPNQLARFPYQYSVMPTAKQMQRAAVLRNTCNPVPQRYISWRNSAKEHDPPQREPKKTSTMKSQWVIILEALEGTMWWDLGNARAETAYL
ncbi:MAG: hypothetical protein Q9172_006094 [Xanthocarpia lactea]